MSCGKNAVANNSRLEVSELLVHARALGFDRMISGPLFPLIAIRAKNRARNLAGAGRFSKKLSGEW
jgi:hypothetical protein